MKITLQEIIDQVAEQTGATKKLSEDFLHEFFNVIEEALNKNGIAKIKGLGTFKLLTVEERKSVNIQTGEEITIPQHNKVSFAPEKELKTTINKPYSHLETYILSQDGPVDHLPVSENEDEDEDEESEIPVTIDNKNVQLSVESSDEEEKIIVQKETIIKESDVEIDSTTEDDVNMEETEKKKSRKWIIVIILLIILGLIAWLLWCCPDFLKQFVKEEPKTEKTSSKDEINEDEIIDQFTYGNTIIDETSENIYGAETDSTTPNPNRTPEFPGEYMFDKKFNFKLVDFMQANFPSMKLITYGTPREVELKEGKRLTLMALDYYGSKRFWVYIYFYNTDIIQNPNDIPAGTVIKVPRLDKSLADPNSEACINAAWDVQKYLLKM